MRIPKASLRTTWRADWLAEFSIALVVLAFLTREVIFAAVGAGILSALASLGLIFHRKMGILRREIHVAQRLSKTRVFLGDSVEGELTIRNGSREAAQILTVQPVLEKTLSFRLSSSFDQLLRPGTTSRLKFVIATLASGRFYISGFRLAFTDARGLFTSEAEYVQAGSVVEVYPGVRRQAPPTPLRLYGGGLEVFRKAPAGTDYAGIREYVPGDGYLRVEWKATARLRKLMVKEFHPETQSTLQILIDAGKTMRQQSYVGTKLDEALAVAQLLAEATMGSEKRLGIWVYDETNVVKAIKPAKAESQLQVLRALALDYSVLTKDPQSDKTIPGLRVSLEANMPIAGRTAAFLRLLVRELAFGRARTGVFKALTEVPRSNPDSLVIVLTDLQINNESLLRAVSLQGRMIRTIVVQIGAAWRLSDSLEEAYVNYEGNTRTLQRFRNLGLVVLDVEPEILMMAVNEELGRHATARRPS